MCSIDIIKPLATVLSSAVNKSQQPQRKNSTPGLLGEKQVCHLCALQPPRDVNFILRS